MRIAIFAYDRPGLDDLRRETRKDHLSYIEKSGVVEQAGPLLDDESHIVGSLIILWVADISAARAWSDKDPYTRVGLFENVTYLEWNRVIG